MRLGCVAFLRRMAVRHPISSALGAMTAALLALAIPATAAPMTAATATVSCPTGSVQSAINAATPGVETTITVTGTCTENVDVPAGYIIVLQSGTSAGAVQQKLASAPGILVMGRLTLKNFTVKSTLTSSKPVLVATKMGFILINGATLTGTGNTYVAVAWETSTIEMYDTNITGGTGQALLVMENAHVYIGVTNAGTYQIKSDNSGAEAIGCYQGNILMLIDAGSTYKIGPATRAFGSNNCVARFGYDTSGNTGSIQFSGTDRAVQAKNGDMITISNATLSNTGNSGAAVEEVAGSVTLDKVTVSGTGVGVAAKSGGIVYFRSFSGTSTVSGTAGAFQCYQNGKIYANTSVISGRTTDTAATDCLVIGGTWTLVQ